MKIAYIRAGRPLTALHRVDCEIVIRISGTLRIYTALRCPPANWVLLILGHTVRAHKAFGLALSAHDETDIGHGRDCRAGRCCVAFRDTIYPDTLIRSRTDQIHPADRGGRERWPRR